MGDIQELIRNETTSNSDERLEMINIVRQDQNKFPYTTRAVMQITEEMRKPKLIDNANMDIIESSAALAP